MNGNKENSGQTAPVDVGDELDVTIEAVGEKGDGIAKKDGFVLFIPNVKEGDKVRIKVNKVLQKVGFADAIGEAESAGEPEQPEEDEQEISEEEMANDSEDFGESEEEGAEEEDSDEPDDASEEPEDSGAEEEEKQ